MSADPPVETVDLRKRYRKGPWANDGITLAAAAGEILGLVGPNGAGKTTLIRQITTELRPTSGQVRVFGIDAVTRPHEVKRLIGVMPQEAALYWGLPVRHHLRVFALPVSKGAYIAGSLLYSTASGAVIVPLLFGFGVLSGVPATPTWALLPLLGLAVLTVAGLTLFVVSFAPSMQVGNMATALLSLLLAALSPVYFTMEQAPLLLRMLGYVSPLRYAADGITKSLAGRADAGFELAVLAGYALVTMAAGAWRLPWRED